ncbi:hypothetical protein CI109_107178 [Kwoniella shandongensis]|uniref:Uncharacterized protein n=1 Tax=Kwoniella shandongensis TaxID=1734106 RepID=A0A5M6C387_9TREE|nr:uncharacterized protein CI109_002461 [Kwoniella shandongensis]KAA5529120.1 hypothetical protein CI109_002461 [Kwoniella shandongensis]
MSGPLGPLRGMTFDPIKNRYFPTPKGPPPPPSRSSLSPSPPLRRIGDERNGQSSSFNSANAGGGWMSSRPGCFEGRMKRRLDEEEGGEGSTGLRGGRMGGRVRRGMGMGRQRRADAGVPDEQRILSSLELEAEHHSCGCHGEIITSHRSFGEEAYFATTDHGKLVIHNSEGSTSVFSVCAQNLVGIHIDIPRMVTMAIAGGPDPHLHLFKRDPEMLNHVFMTHSELGLKTGDIYGMSSFDDICTLGSAKSLTTINYTDRLTSIHRRLFSDALAVHQTSRDLVFVGQRSGNVALEDLRISSRIQNVVASTQRGKAVVGVKRLSDAAVPWGLAVSGMGDEMLLFDVRFGDRPLRTLQGHVNSFHTVVSMATSQDDRFLFASGSDRRIRCWSTVTGETISPPSAPADGNDLDNPLVRTFNQKISAMSVRDDLGLDVVVRGELMRFGRREYV